MNVSAWRRIKKTRIYALTREVKWRVEEFASSDQRRRYSVVALSPEGPRKGNVLLSRINRAFFRKPGEPIPATHQNVWEAYQMAQIFLRLGFAVDVIDFENDSFLPTKEYAIFVDARENMERIAPFLDRRCVKVFHAATADPLFQNSAEMKRLLALQNRRGVTLRPRRQIALNRGAEQADCVVVLGNEFTLRTYCHANKRLYRVPLAVPINYAWPEDKDFDHARNRFLFFSGAGMVHKGLDRILEAFAGMPEFSLTVCGPVENERDFLDAYRRELYETENIHMAGWIDLSSDQFVQMAKDSIGLIHASCSESGCASVITGMHAGLIPLASYESSVDIDPSYGVILEESSVEEIRDAVRSIASLPSSQLGKMARTAWQHARENHSPEAFVSSYTRFVSEIQASSGADRAPAVREVITR